MEHIKLFESKIMDDILDKMLSSGKESLTEWENEFLLKYGTPEGDKMEKSFKNDNATKSYKETDKSDNNESEFDSDEHEELWDTIDMDEMNEFLVKHKIMPEFGEKSWNNLPKVVKDKFDSFLKQKGFI